MFKKLASTLAAATLLATGLNLIVAPASLATNTIATTSISIPTGVMEGGNPLWVTLSPNAMPGGNWTSGQATWSPAVSGTFASNTVYTATYTLTTATGYEFPAVSANGFSIYYGSAGATDTTLTSNAVSAGATTATVSITFPNTTAPAPVITSSSTISNGAVNPVVTIASAGKNFQTMPNGYTISTGTTGLTLWGTNTAISGTSVLTFRGTARGGTLSIQVKASGFAPTASGDSNTLSFVIPGGSSSNNSNPSASDLAAQAAAAAQAAREAAAAKVAAAQTVLYGIVKADKPASLAEYRAANLDVKNQATLDRVNASVLKLSSTVRADAEQLKAQIAAIVKTENFVTTVSDAVAKQGVTSTMLVANNVLDANSPYKASVTSALRSIDTSKLTTIAAIKAAVAEQVRIAKARRDRNSAIIAKIESRK